MLEMMRNKIINCLHDNNGVLTNVDLYKKLDLPKTADASSAFKLALEDLVNKGEVKIDANSVGVDTTRHDGEPTFSVITLFLDVQNFDISIKDNSSLLG